MHPQTLASATMLLYIEGLFNLVRGQSLFLVGIVMFPGGGLLPTTSVGAGASAWVAPRWPSSSASRGTA